MDIKTNSLDSYLSQIERVKDFVDLVTSGSYNVLLLVKDNEGISYSEVLRYARENKIASRSYVSNGLRDLQEKGLIYRRALNKKPIRTSYRVTKKGNKTIDKFDRILKRISLIE